MSTKKSSQKGFSAVELIIYVGLLGLILSTLLSGMIAAVKSYRTVKTLRIAHESTLVSFHRIGYESRLSYDIDQGGSVLGNDVGVLLLKQNIAGEDVVKIMLENNRIAIYKNNVLEGYLTDEALNVTRLRFDYFTDNNAKVVTLDVAFTASLGSYSTDQSFRSSYVLRGSY